MSDKIIWTWDTEHALAETKGRIRMEVELISSYTVCKSCGHQFIPMTPAAACEEKRS